jgi:hypothetical protein
MVRNGTWPLVRGSGGDLIRAENGAGMRPLGAGGLARSWEIGDCRRAGSGHCEVFTQKLVTAKVAKKGREGR